MSVLPRIALFLQYVLPRNSRNTQNLLAVYSPTDCTDLHRTFLLYILPRIALFLQYVLPRNSRNTQNLLAVCSPTEFTERTEPSCCIFSHGIHGIHRTFLLYILPQIARIFTDVAFRGCTCLKCTNPFCCCTSCSVGVLLALLVHLRQVHPLERTYLCRSVKSVGEYFQQPLP
jgi:hypothetical protein